VYDRGHLRQNLPDDDPVRPLAGEAGGGDEVPAAQRGGLTAQHPRAPCPTGDGDDGDAHRDTTIAEVGGDDDHQRQRRNHQEQVDDEVDDFTDPAADITPTEPDQHRDDGGDATRAETDQHTDPGTVEQLTEGIFARAGG